jgi:hypothetical protein
MAKEKVNCSFCGKEIYRLKWNYSKKRPIKEFFCDNKCKGGWQKKQRELDGFTKEWLVDEYINKNRSMNDIAREIGRDPKRVWEWAKDYGIKTRPKGTDYGQNFKKGHVSYWKGKKLPDSTKEKIRQSSIKDGRVPYLKDGIHWLKHDGAKPGTWKGGVTPDRQAVYSSNEWCEAVKTVWKRDNAICQRCGKHHNTTKARGTFHIHHIVSFKNKEKRTDVNNLILLCKECHRWVHSNKNTNKEFIEED